MPHQDKFTVEDVQPGGRDLTQAEIEEVYSKVPPLYAVYRTPRRVAVQYADDDGVAASQRAKLAPLNSLRAQINGLIDGWRGSRFKTFQAKAQRYDGRVAAALILCLEGDGTTALASLTQTRDDINGERESWGRLEYLISALVVLLGLIALFTLVQKRVWTFDHPQENIWLAGRAGAVGAFFSIALAIRNRTVLTNLNRRDNIADAVLRIVIGVVGAGVLVLLLGSGLLNTVTIGGAEISGSGLIWQKVLVIGFVAGFLERLVPDLLSRNEAAAPVAGAAASASGAALRLAPAPGAATLAPAPPAVPEPEPAAAAVEPAAPAAPIVVAPAPALLTPAARSEAVARPAPAGAKKE